MKRDIKWLMQWIEEYENEVAEERKDELNGIVRAHSHGQLSAIKRIKQKIDLLYESELPVIPNEVKEEQKYVLLINITDKPSKTNYETYLNKRGIFHSMENESFNSEEFNWSEEEIKDLENGEILFEHFAVKVEEMEE